MGKITPQVGEMPVIALSTSGEEGLPEEERVLRVPCPCETKVLVDQIEATLLDVPAGHLLLLLLKPGRGESALEALMRVFMTLGIVASCDEADRPRARVMMRGK